MTCFTFLPFIFEKRYFSLVKITVREFHCFCINVLYLQLVHPLNFSLFYLCLHLTVFSAGLNILYSYCIETTSPYSHTLCSSFAFSSISGLPLAWPLFHSYPSLFWYLLIVQWNFCFGITTVHVLCLSQYNTALLTSWSFLPMLCCLTVFSVFPCVLFLQRCDVFHYCSLSFFPSFPPSFVSSTSLTFGYMLCICFYIYIMLAFVLGLYHIWEKVCDLWFS
jgi:hypothetical protein